MNDRQPAEVSPPPGEDGPSLDNATSAIHILLNHYQDLVVPGLRAVGDPEDHFIEVALITRTTPLVEAALTLAEGGFGRETMMLNRPLFELMLDARWTHANPTKAGDMFLAHARFTQHLQREKFRRYPQLGVDVRPQTLPPEEIKQAKKRFGSYAEKSWTGLNVKERVELVEPQLDSVERPQLWFVFHILHGLNNAELHPSSWSLARALRRVKNDDGSYKFQYRAGPEPELAPFALGATWWIYLKQLDLAHELTALQPDSLQAAADAGAELLGLTAGLQQD